MLYVQYQINLITLLSAVTLMIVTIFVMLLYIYGSCRQYTITHPILAIGISVVGEKKFYCISVAPHSCQVESSSAILLCKQGMQKIVLALCSYGMWPEIQILYLHIIIMMSEIDMLNPKTRLLTATTRYCI